MRTARRMPRFERAAILGVGLIGGSIGMALRERGLAKKVAGFGRRREALEMARRLGAIDEIARSAEEAVAGADLVVLSAPVRAIIQHARMIGPHLQRGALVTDVGSTKEKIVAACERHLPAGVHFVGGHPMAGSEKSGVNSARAGLFEGAVWIITPTSKSKPSAVGRLDMLVSALGARPLLLSPSRHDLITAAVSHLAHVAAACLVQVASDMAGEQGETWRIAASGFRATTRIASGPPAVWRDVCWSNSRRLLEAVRALGGELRKWERALEARDAEKMEGLLDRAKKIRDAI